MSYPQQPVPTAPAHPGQPPYAAPQPWGQQPYAAQQQQPAAGRQYAQQQQPAAGRQYAQQQQPAAAAAGQPYAGPPGQAGVTTFGPPGVAPFGQLAVTACRLCGSVPAAPAKFRGHQGFVVMMRFLSLDGPFCRDCGLATFRSMTSRTLVQGWYGYASFIITPITVLMNIARRGRVAGLPAPQPNPYGPSRPPLPAGPRLLQRPMTIIGLGIPFALIILLVVLIGLDG